MNKAPGVIFTTFQFLVTYHWAQKARVFVPGKPSQPNLIQHTSIMGTLIGYEENKVKFQNFIAIRPSKLECYITPGCKIFPIKNTLTY